MNELMRRNTGKAFQLPETTYRGGLPSERSLFHFFLWKPRSGWSPSWKWREVPKKVLTVKYRRTNPWLIVRIHPSHPARERCCATAQLHPVFGRYHQPWTDQEEQQLLALHFHFVSNPQLRASLRLPPTPNISRGAGKTELFLGDGTFRSCSSWLGPFENYKVL